MISGEPPSLSTRSKWHPAPATCFSMSPCHRDTRSTRWPRPDSNGRSAAGVADLAPEATGSIVNPSFPLQISANFNAGTGSITGDLYIVYCESEQESICLIDQARVVVPVTVGSGGSTVPITYAIELPDL